METEDDKLYSRSIKSTDRLCLSATFSPELPTFVIVQNTFFTRIRENNSYAGQTKSTSFKRKTKDALIFTKFLFSSFTTLMSESYSLAFIHHIERFSNLGRGAMGHKVQVYENKGKILT